MIKVLEKALDLLEYMSYDNSREYPLSELAGVTGDALSTTANILKTLCEREYLARGNVRGTYRLGRLAQGITPYAGLDERLRQAALKPMQTLVQETNASGVMSAIRAKEKKVLARYRSDSVLEVNMEIVASGALFSTSTGLVLLANMDDYGESVPNARKRAEVVFESWDYYLRVMENVRENEYYYGSLKPSVAEAAVPLHVNGKVIAAVGIYFPKLYEESMSKIHILAALMRTAEAIEKQLEV